MFNQRFIVQVNYDEHDGKAILNRQNNNKG